jgi:hypothetical protein
MCEGVVMQQQWQKHSSNGGATYWMVVRQCSGGYVAMNRILHCMG